MMSPRPSAPLLLPQLSLSLAARSTNRPTGRDGCACRCWSYTWCEARRGYWLSTVTLCAHAGGNVGKAETGVEFMGELADLDFSSKSATERLFALMDAGRCNLRISTLGRCSDSEARW